MGISRECFFSALFAKAKALSKKIHSRVSGGASKNAFQLLVGRVEKDSLLRKRKQRRKDFTLAWI